VAGPGADEDKGSHGSGTQQANGKDSDDPLPRSQIPFFQPAFAAILQQEPCPADREPQTRLGDSNSRASGALSRIGADAWKRKTGNDQAGATEN